MQTKRQLKQCTRNVHPSFADFWPGLGVNFHILLTQNWLWESSLSLLSLWCILFQIKLGLFRENLNLKKHLGPKNGWSSPSTFWHRLIYIIREVMLTGCFCWIRHQCIDDGFCLLCQVLRGSRWRRSMTWPNPWRGQYFGALHFLVCCQYAVFHLEKIISIL